MKRGWVSWAVMLLGFALGGCAPQWRVISQAAPNPLAGKHEFSVLPVDFAGLKIGKKTEEQFLADEKKDDKKKNESAESLAGDKAEMARSFQQKLVAEAAGRGIKVAAGGDLKTFVLKPRIAFMEPGFFAVVASGPSHVILRLAIEDKDGKLLDKIEFSHKTLPNSWASVESRARYRADAEAIGKLVGRYLQTRVTSN